MHDRDGAGARLWGVALVLAMATTLAACSSASTSTLGLDAVATEREARAEARVETLLASYGEYLESRWPGILLPETRIDAWLDPSVWTAAFERCASQASGLTVRIDPTAGVFATPAPRTAGQLRDFETAIYLCQGQLPPPTLAVNEPGPVETAWLDSYVRDALPTCLRRQGVAAEPGPRDALAIRSGGATSGWDPYAAARGDGPALRRLQALCPPPEVLLDSIPPLGESS
ncbi:MAG: hypothetical protein RL499_1245 [Actinomycetota bacterium]